MDALPAARRPRRPRAAAAALTGAALIGGLVAAADAPTTNTGPEARLVVQQFDGSSVEGEVELKKDRLEVKGPRRARVRYRDVARLSEPTPSTEEALAAEWARRRDRAAKAEGAAEWLRAGRWALEAGLVEEAREAFERALAADPASEDAQRGLGRARGEDGAWVEAGPLVWRRDGALAPGDHDGRVALARFAREHGQDEPAFSLLLRVLRADNFHQGALGAVRPYVARYRQKRALGLPVRGRWKASEDRTRHHQLKCYALEALDLTKVDADGRHHRGNGRALEDHYAFDAPFYAVAAGRVVEVRDGQPDNPIGKIGDQHDKHNGVAIDHGDGELSWYVHARAGTITVKQGDQVERGQLLGRIGNSGSTAVPHLHFAYVAYTCLSVPWRVDALTLIAPDGTPLRVEAACPREGWTFESVEPEEPPGR